jgi:hypothetical protein
MEGSGTFGDIPCGGTNRPKAWDMSLHAGERPEKCLWVAKMIAFILSRIALIFQNPLSVTTFFRNFLLRKKVLPFENAKKNFAFCSLIRTFAA